ncbi:hypothetical protein NHX12_010155 [Muraenolepis orangiensis]|uniref:Uncharacterized protein n=1 Tax=Muraenolepis orangiensis TaxID=630683 RepID=A0A9Q0DLP3_9TELE|nr:hypothetical protein NHX12_010155 [Muraenolepis orangiensis]
MDPNASITIITATKVKGLSMAPCFVCLYINGVMLFSLNRGVPGVSSLPALWSPAAQRLPPPAHCRGCPHVWRDGDPPHHLHVRLLIGAGRRHHHRLPAHPRRHVAGALRGHLPPAATQPDLHAAADGDRGGDGLAFGGGGPRGRDSVLRSSVPPGVRHADILQPARAADPPQSSPESTCL